MARELAVRDREALPAVGEAGQPVGAAELVQQPVLLRDLARQQMRDDVDRDRIDHDERNAGDDHRHRRIDVDRETQRRRREPAGRDEHDQRPREEARAAEAHLVDREHRDQQDARQEVELHHRNPHAAEHRVDEQIAHLGIGGLAAALRDQHGHVRPDEAVQREQHPPRRRGVVRGAAPTRRTAPRARGPACAAGGCAGRSAARGRAADRRRVRRQRRMWELPQPAPALPAAAVLPTSGSSSSSRALLLPDALPGSMVRALRVAVDVRYRAVRRSPPVSDDARLFLPTLSTRHTRARCIAIFLPVDPMAQGLGPEQVRRSAACAPDAFVLVQPTSAQRCRGRDGRGAQPLGRRSMTRFALPSERSIVAGGTTRTSAVTPIIDLMRCARRAPAASPSAEPGAGRALDDAPSSRRGSSAA